MNRNSSSRLVVAVAVTGGIFAGMALPALSAKQMTDAEIGKALHLPADAEIIRKNGKRFLVTPLPDDAVERMVSTQTMMARVKKEQGIPDRDERHKGSESTYFKARALMEANKLEAATPIFTSYINQFVSESKSMKDEKKDEHDYYLSWGYQCRGFCYLEQKQWESGIKDLTNAIALRPTYAMNYINRAKAYKQIGDTKHADDDSKMAKALLERSMKKQGTAQSQPQPRTEPQRQPQLLHQD